MHIGLRFRARPQPNKSRLMDAAPQLEALRGTHLSINVHTLVEYTDDFDVMKLAYSEENYVAALREFLITLSNLISSRSYLGCRREFIESIKQVAYVGVTFLLSPLQHRVGSNPSHIFVGCDRKPELSHPC